MEDLKNIHHHQLNWHLSCGCQDHPRLCVSLVCCLHKAILLDIHYKINSRVLAKIPLSHERFNANGLIHYCVYFVLQLDGRAYLLWNTWRSTIFRHLRWFLLQHVGPHDNLQLPRHHVASILNQPLVQSLLHHLSRLRPVPHHEAPPCHFLHQFQTQIWR